MTRSPVREPVSIDGRFREITAQITTLQRRCQQGLCCQRRLQSVADLLSCLPLSTEEYGRARCHVENARRYLAAGERGAGGYELRMLAGALGCAFHPLRQAHDS